jgi:hypothetical protein
VVAHAPAAQRELSIAALSSTSVDEPASLPVSAPLIAALREYIDESRRLLHRDIANVQLDVFRQFESLVDEQREAFASVIAHQRLLQDQIAALQQQNETLIQRLLF